ncbi:MAG TPA: hypothetical protein VMI15_02575 [Burkholderiales bacterium]|nr:hypothetical protein [Burkholderiales bacterium]
MRTLLLALCFTALPAAAGPATIAFPEAAASFQRALAGDKDEVGRAIAAFESLARADAAQPLYEAYLGAAQTLRARDAWMPWNKVRYAEEGLDHIDHALKSLSPENGRQLLRGVPAGLETRLTAASTFLKLPDGIFHRRAQGKSLVAALAADPALAAAPEGFRKAVADAAREAAKP